MKKNTIKLLAVTLAASVTFLTPAMNVEAGLLSKSVSAKNEKIEKIVSDIHETKVEERKEFLRKQGVEEDVIEQLDELEFFDKEIDDFIKVDVSTNDDVKVIVDGNNINIEIYFSFITINKK